MPNPIIQYLSQYTSISKELEEATIESDMIRSYPKGTILLKEGGLSNACYFVIKGCIRSYYLRDGEEKTTEFYTESQSVTPSVYGKQKPSEHYLECVEGTIAGVGTPETETQMYKVSTIRNVKSYHCRSHDGKISGYFFAEFKMDNPEQRYLNLIKNRPDLLQRVPQHQIASYLDIKPESLSRIRKRIVDKQK